MDKIIRKSDEVLIIVTPPYLGQDRKDYQNDKYKEVKEVSTDITNLCKDVNLFLDMDRYMNIY